MIFRLKKDVIGEVETRPLLIGQITLQILRRSPLLSVTSPAQWESIPARPILEFEPMPASGPNLEMMPQVNYRLFSGIVMELPLKDGFLIRRFAIPRMCWLLVIQCMFLEKPGAKVINCSSALA